MSHNKKPKKLTTVPCRQQIEKKFFLSFVRKIYNQNRKSNSDYSYAGVSTAYFLIRFYLFANLTISTMRRCVCAAFVNTFIVTRSHSKFNLVATIHEAIYEITTHLLFLAHQPSFVTTEPLRYSQLTFMYYEISSNLTMST